MSLFLGAYIRIRIDLKRLIFNHNGSKSQDWTLMDDGSNSLFSQLESKWIIRLTLTPLIIP